MASSLLLCYAKTRQGREKLQRKEARYLMSKDDQINGQLLGGNLLAVNGVEHGRYSHEAVFRKSRNESSTENG